MLKGDGHSDENRTLSLNPSHSVGVPIIFFYAMGYDMPSRRMSRDIRHEGIYYFKT